MPSLSCATAALVLLFATSAFAQKAPAPATSGKGAQAKKPKAQAPEQKAEPASPGTFDWNALTPEEREAKVEEILRQKGGDPEAHGEPFFSWGTIPGVVEVVEIPHVVLSNGIPVTMTSVKSKARPEDLVEYFGQRFQSFGLYIPPHGELTRLLEDPQVVALDPESMTAYSVILQPRPDKTINVIMSEAHMGLAEKLAMAEIAPVHPSGTQVMKSQMEGAQTVSYLVKVKEEEVMGFYRKALAADGFAEKEPGSFEKPGQRIEVFTRPAPDGRLSVVAISHGDIPFDPAVPGANP